MPSRAEVRAAGEWACRLGALGLLGWSLWSSASAVGRRPSAATTDEAPLAAGRDTAAITAQLGEWSRRADLARLRVTLDGAPDARTRNWLRALDQAGTDVAWMGEVPATAIAVESVASPAGGAQVSVAAPDGSPVVISDAAGRIDSLGAARGGASIRAATSIGSVAMHTGATIARAPQAAPRMIRGVVLIGAAGWEAKFVAAALEEQGWPVTVRLRVAPGLAVGSPAAFDTARTAVVVALDSTAASDAAAIAGFVRSGGGLVLGPGASRVAAFAALAPARPGSPIAAATSFAAAIAPVTRKALARTPLVALRPDAVALERREDTVLVAARRVDAGRVVQVGYDETWRWRMAGGDDSPDEHRAWWSQLVESVAYAPTVSDPGNIPATNRAPDAGVRPSDPAPRAALVAALGETSDARSDAAPGAPVDPSRNVWVYISAALLLLVEWASRRLRGAR